MTIRENERRQQQPRKPRRYLRKADLAERYGWKSTLSVDRAWQQYGTLPAPTIYRGRFPLWDEDVLDAHDACAPRESNRSRVSA
jgi:hypothetical protein